MSDESPASDDRQGVVTLAWLWLNLLAWLSHVGLAAALGYRLFIAGPRYQQTFQDFGMRLPAVTEAIFQVSSAGAARAVELEWLLIFLSILDAGFLLILAKWERPLWKWWFWGVVVVLILGLLVAEYALLLASMKLHEGLAR
jgi:hypothetical protein